MSALSAAFGLPILEAMACACPVVTSNIRAMPETAGRAAVLRRPPRPGLARPRDLRRQRVPKRTVSEPKGSVGLSSSPGVPPPRRLWTSIAKVAERRRQRR